MVTKAPVKSAPGKKPSTAVQPWEAEFAAAAKKQAAVEKPMGLFKQVQIRAGNMFIDDKPIPGNAFDSVILAATHENQYFDKPYDPNVPAVPACYAFGDRNAEDPQAEMRPMTGCDSPQGFPLTDKGELDESSGERSCENCWANVMGSADTGKGKACSNVRRMILITADGVDSASALKEAEARSLKVPVMSVRNWVGHMHTLAEEMSRPCYGVVTQVSTVPDKKSQWQVKFGFQELVNFDEDLYGEMKKRVSQAEKDLLTPYPKLEEQAAPPRGGKGAAAAKGGKPTGPATRKPSKY